MKPSDNMTCFLCLFLVFACSALTAQQAPMAEKKALTELASRKAGLDTAAMLQFYEENSPDLLYEWRQRLERSTEDANAYLDLLATHFLGILAYKNRNPQEFKRLIAQQKTEYHVRQLSRSIQNLAPQNDAKLKLQELKTELANILDHNFDEAQQRQQLEITRLENELKNLKNMAQERAKNKWPILKQKFFSLTGQQWPEPNAEEKK